jgi:anaerobic ribonucleoside-triphosphate reductase
MKIQIHNIATATISLAMVTALSSCKDEEKSQTVDEIMAPYYNQQRQQQETQRRAQQDAIIDATGRAVGVAGEVIGSAIQERNRQQNSSGGRQTQQQYDQSLQREYYLRESEKNKDRVIQGILAPKE